MENCVKVCEVFRFDKFISNLGESNAPLQIVFSFVADV